MICNKKIVYWGGGLICKTCLEYYPETRPDFIIDSNPKCKINDLQVCSPDEISNWKDLFIVITTVYGSEIEKKLEQFGLKRGEDFLFYKNFFNINTDIISSLNAISKYVRESLGCKKCVLLYIPCFTCRQKESMTNFFKQYVVWHNDINFVVISVLEVVPEEVASEKIGAKVFNLPDIVRWDGSERKYELCYDKIGNKDSLLTEEVKKIEERKISFNYEKSLSITTNLYLYLKSLFEILHPGKLIIWGEWSRTSYIFAELAKKNNIPYGFMEWGWIPGTLQFDPVGIAGQSEYAVNPAIFNNNKNKFTNIDLVEKIKRYVLNNQLDTGIFKIIPEDEKQLSKLDSTKKTVFLVGMGDIEMGMNSDCDYWKEYVSDIVSSTKDSYNLIREICKSNNLNFIYKPHPHSRTKVEDDMYRSDLDTIYITDMSIDKLIDMSDVVVSIASAVDYKALMYNKALVSLGKTGFNGKNCVYEVHSRKEVESKLLLAIEKGISAEQISNYNRFLQFLLENYLWDDLSHPDFQYGLSLNKDFFDK